MPNLLTAQPRIERGKQLKRVRRQGFLPMVMYGHGEPPRELSANIGDFERVWHRAGSTTLVDLMIDKDKPVKILIHNLQYHPLTDRVIHADLYRVKLTEKIRTMVPIQLSGEAPAVKELQGTLIINKNEVEVESLPQNLVSSIATDISQLKTFDDVIHVHDLVVPANVEIIDDPEAVVALVQPPRSEEELAELEEKPVEDVESVAVEEKGREDEIMTEDANALKHQVTTPKIKSQVPDS